MFKSFLSAAVLAGLLLPQGAVAEDRYTDPKALVEAIYAGYVPGAAKGDPTIYYSDQLKALAEEAAHHAVLVSDAAMAGQGFAPTLTFNPFLPDDNALLFDLVIGEPMIRNDRALVSVSYHNFDALNLLSIALVRVGDVWKVADVASLGAETPWLLSWALTSDPYAN